MRNKKKILKISARTALMVLAGLINALGVGLLLVPYNFIDGGISGVSFLISHFSGLEMGIFILCLNLPFFLIGIKMLGKKFIIASVISIASYGVFLLLFGLIPNRIIETDQIILPAIFGGLLSGIGSGLTIRMGGSLDGVEVMAILINRKTDISVGKLVMAFNVVIMIIAGFVFEWENALFSIIAYAVGINAIDFVVSGLDKLKNVIVITNHGDKVATAISENFGQGITVIDSKGFYSKEHRSFIYFIVSRFELSLLKDIVTTVDPDAVISITETTEVLGKNMRNRRSPLALKRQVRQPIVMGVCDPDEEFEAESVCDKDVYGDDSVTTDTDVSADVITDISQSACQDSGFDTAAIVDDEEKAVAYVTGSDKENK